MTNKTLVVIGSGPGIGVAAASRLSTQHFSHIALISRDAARLPHDRARVLAAAEAGGKSVDVQTWSCDATDTPRLEGVLKEVEALGPLACVLYNAALVVPTELFAAAEEEIVYHFKTTSVGLYTTARWVLPLLRRAGAAANPAFLVPTSFLYDEPIPQLFSLSVAKAAQRTLVLALAKAWPDVHVALLYIDGPVSEDAVKNNPRGIAEALGRLYAQERGQWEGGMVV